MGEDQYQQVQEMGQNTLDLALKTGDDQSIAQVYFYLASTAGQLGI